jgi:hypothetical protein
MTEVEEQALAWLDESPYLIQRDLGKRVGVSSHVVGRLLEELGLRCCGHPHQDAYRKKMVEVDRSGPWPQYKWNERRVVPLLKYLLQQDECEQVHELN